MLPRGGKKAASGGRQGAMAHAANSVVVMVALLAGGTATVGTWGRLALGEALLTGLFAVLLTMMVGGFATSSLARSAARHR
jgi:hypothetical protein